MVFLIVIVCNNLTYLMLIFFMNYFYQLLFSLRHTCEMYTYHIVAYRVNFPFFNQVAILC